MSSSCLIKPIQDEVWGVREGGGGIGGGERDEVWGVGGEIFPPTSFFPVTSTNVELALKTF